VPMDNPALVKPRLQATVRKIREVSTLPHIALKIIQLTSDPKSSVAQLEEVIKSDPGLTAKVLKMANSAHFALREEVKDIRKAVVFMGFKQVKDLALGASVCDIFKNNTPIGHYTRSGLWRHSVCVAITSKVIAQRAGKDLTDFVFSTGILHDIGIVMLDQYLHEHFYACMTHPKALPRGLPNIEDEIIGWNHQDLAKEVIAGWKLPDEFTYAVSCHHRPQAAKGEYRDLVSIVYLAGVLCDSHNFGYAEAPKVTAPEFNFALRQLDFKKTDVTVILEELPDEFEKALDLINMVDT